MEAANQTVEIRKVWEGRMGNDKRPVWEAHVGGKLVVFHERKWLVAAVADAVALGHISGEGNTVASFSKWAEKNAPEIFARIVATGADGLW